MSNSARAAAASTASLRAAHPFHIADADIAALLGHDKRDALFVRGWEEGSKRLTRRERSAVAGVTGHIAESAAEEVLTKRGWYPLWHFATTGGHCVDLVMLSPDEKIVAVEVKGTVVAGRIPRRSRRELGQMSSEWIDKPDNPGIANVGVESADVYGAVMVVNFADRQWRVALTADFVGFRPVV